VPDLHGWITQQIDERERLTRLISPGGYAPDEWRIEPSRSGRWAQIVAYSRTNIEPPEAAVRDSEQPVALVQTGRNEHLLMAMHDPAAVLRRCEADRRILARHRLDPDCHYEPACLGCRTYGDQEMAYTDNLNECPELLDLGYAHGLTPEILATLDQPETPPRPEPRPPVDLKAWVDSMTIRPAPSVPPALRGPNWPGPA